MHDSYFDLAYQDQKVKKKREIVVTHPIRSISTRSRVSDLSITCLICCCSSWVNVRLRVIDDVMLVCTDQPAPSLQSDGKH